MTWAAEGGVLTLETTKTLDKLPYCVEGDALAYRPSDTDGLFTFHRAYRAGAPQACNQRTGKACEIGGDCVLGECVGTGSCAGQSATTCAKYQGCSWSATSCHGEVTELCTLQDFAEAHQVAR